MMAMARMRDTLSRSQLPRHKHDRPSSTGSTASCDVRITAPLRFRVFPSAGVARAPFVSIHVHIARVADVRMNASCGDSNTCTLRSLCFSRPRGGRLST